MKMPKKVITKVLIGFVLVVLAAVSALLIKEYFDTRAPEAALPIMTLKYEGRVVPGVYRAGYEWSFFMTIARQAPQVSVDDLPLTPIAVQPQMPMELEFSRKSGSARIWRAAGRFGNDFIELTDVNIASLSTPSSAGIYVYKVLADWGSRGNVQYYFALDVQ